MAEITCLAKVSAVGAFLVFMWCSKAGLWFSWWFFKGRTWGLHSSFFRCAGSVEGHAGARSDCWCWYFPQLHSPRFLLYWSNPAGPPGECVSVCVLESERELKFLLSSLQLTTFQDTGISLESEGFVSSMVRKMAVTNLVELYNRCKCTCAQSNTFQMALLHLEQP